MTLLAVSLLFLPRTAEAQDITWDHVLDGPSIRCIASGSWGRLVAGSQSGAIYLSRDDGSRWEEIYRYSPGESVIDIVEGPDSTFFIATFERLYRASSDFLSQDTLSLRNVNALWSSEGGKLLAGVRDELLASTDGGQTFRKVAQGESDGASLRGSLRSPLGVLYGTIGGHEFTSGALLASWDAGQSWEPVLDAPTTVAIELPSGRLIAGGYHGWWFSDNSGESWLESTGGFGPAVSVEWAGEGLLFATAQFEGILASADSGASWTVRTFGDGIGYGKLWRGSSGRLFHYGDGIHRSQEIFSTATESPELGTPPGLSVFPSPSRDIISVDAAADFDLGLLTIYDTLGRVVQGPRTVASRSMPVAMDISHLPRGVYFLVLQMGSVSEATSVVTTH